MEADKLPDDDAQIDETDCWTAIHVPVDKDVSNNPDTRTVKVESYEGRFCVLGYYNESDTLVQRRNLATSAVREAVSGGEFRLLV